MHQVQVIPNNNADFAFEKADPKTLEIILKKLENQEKELLKESTQKTHNKHLGELRSLNEKPVNFFQPNFQNNDANYFYGNNLTYSPTFPNSNQFLTRAKTSFGFNYDLSSHMPQTHLNTINPQTMFEMNDFYRF